MPELCLKAGWIHFCFTRNFKFKFVWRTGLLKDFDQGPNFEQPGFNLKICLNYVWRQAEYIFALLEILSLKFVWGTGLLKDFDQGPNFEQTGFNLKICLNYVWKQAEYIFALLEILS